MAGKVAVGHLQPLFQGGKVCRFVDHQHGHDAEPGAVLECFVYILEVQFHFCFPCLSWKKMPYRMWNKPNPMVQNKRGWAETKQSANPNRSSA